MGTQVLVHIEVFFQKMQANKTQIQINPNTNFEKSLWPFSRPLNLSSSPHQPSKLAFRYKLCPKNKIIKLCFNN
jgi:hypothetical protein